MRRLVVLAAAAVVATACAGSGRHPAPPTAAGAQPPASAAAMSPVGSIVTGLQEDLHRLGYEPGAMSATFTDATVSALIAFQVANHVPERNALGPLTAEALAARLPAASGAVRALQSALTDVGLFDGTIDGHYGSDLLAAVQRLQHQSGLPADGEYGPLTAAALDRLYVARVPGATPVPPAPTTTMGPTTTTDPDNMMQPGRQSARVLALQQRLAALGYRPGTVDGYYGAATASAVLAFEKREGLSRDGVAGPEVQARVAAPTGAGPHAGLPVPRIEVDLTRQIAFFVAAGGAVTTLNVSTGSGLTYTDPVTGAQDVAYTPVGTFHVYREVDSDVQAPLGTLHKPLYFTGGWAVHGAASVPAWPASHGCVRVSDDDADWLFPQVPVGTTVVIYGGTGGSTAPAGATPGY